MHYCNNDNDNDNDSEIFTPKCLTRCNSTCGVNVLSVHGSCINTI